MNCLTCGILDKRPNEYYCLRFKKVINSTEAERDANPGCIYYCKVITEDGEPLSPGQHLLLQDQDLRGKKMRGPV